ncbi:hypothetical protein GCM10028832_01310 [Streptomyces sparsus]
MKPPPPPPPPPLPRATTLIRLTRSGTVKVWSPARLNVRTWALDADAVDATDGDSSDATATADSATAQRARVVRTILMEHLSRK